VLLNVWITIILLHSVALAQTFYLPRQGPDYLQGQYCPDEIIIKLKSDRVTTFTVQNRAHGTIETNLPSLNRLNRKWGVKRLTRFLLRGHPSI